MGTRECGVTGDLSLLDSASVIEHFLETFRVLGHLLVRNVKAA
jgi:hypothetical protein